MPESSSHCDSIPIIPMPGRSTRRHPLLCAECQKHFRTAEELYIHSEICVIESFESEAINVFSSMPLLTDSTVNAGNAISAGIMAKGDSPPKLVPETNVFESIPCSSDSVSSRKIQKGERSGNKKTGEMQVMNMSRKASISSLSASETEQPYRLTSERCRKRSFDLGNARVLEVPSGLKIYVSIERESSRRTNCKEAYKCDSNKYESSGTRGGGAPNLRGKVIGALANADDDDNYRPKMECPTCGLVLYRHNFGTHYRIHTGELPFVCTYCQKRFRTTSALKVHTRAHTGEKPYSCPKCSYCCITKRNLDRHIINNHVREGERRGPRERRSRYRREDYDVIIDEIEMDTVEDVENEKIDHHYVIATEEIENADM